MSPNCLPYGGRRPCLPLAATPGGSGHQPCPGHLVLSPSPTMGCKPISDLQLTLTTCCCSSWKPPEQTGAVALSAGLGWDWREHPRFQKGAESSTASSHPAASRLHSNRPSAALSQKPGHHNPSLPSGPSCRVCTEAHAGCQD